MSKKILIAGAGPAGLMAMWACLNYGYEAVLMDVKPKFSAKPPINAGVFILHEPCDLPLRKKKVTVIAGGAHDIGLRQAYSVKVYGKPDVNVSIPNARLSRTTAYDGAQAIDLLWDIAETFGAYQQTGAAGFGSYADIGETAEALGCEAAICTIPMPKLIYRNYSVQTVYVKESTAPPDEAYMIYNANPQVEWYRCSAVFGRFSMEAVNPENKFGWTSINKVIGFRNRETIPNRNDPALLLTGRQGAWDKKKLVHDSYYDTIAWLTTHHR